jgi:hypothetical protein
MSLLVDARKLADYIGLLDDFYIDTAPISGYGHMGALLADAVLQAGLNYRTVVQPRIQRILRDYSDAHTITGLHFLITCYGAGTILNWKHHEKPKRYEELTACLLAASVDTEENLRDWLLLPASCNSLRSIKGIGPKTVDYIKNLAGLSTVAVDRHIFHFAACAGIMRNEYQDIRTVVSYAADLINVPRCSLDRAIWSYLSGDLHQ